MTPSLKETLERAALAVHAARFKTPRGHCPVPEPDADDMEYATRLAQAALNALPQHEDSGGWRPTSEAPTDGRVINVRSVTSYKWVAYKKDGQRQMKAKGRWQRAVGEYGGWENASLPDGEWVVNSPLPSRAPAPTIPEQVESEGSGGEGWRPTHRHVKRGTTYQFVDEADLQTDKPLSDYAVVSVYRGEDGRLWVRPSSEFNDGRFEALPAAPANPQPSGGEYAKLIEEQFRAYRKSITLNLFDGAAEIRRAFEAGIRAAEQLPQPSGGGE